MTITFRELVQREPEEQICLLSVYAGGIYRDAMPEDLAKLSDADLAEAGLYRLSTSLLTRLVEEAQAERDSALARAELVERLRGLVKKVRAGAVPLSLGSFADEIEALLPKESE